MLEHCKKNFLLIQESLKWLNEEPYFASTTCQTWGDSGSVKYEFHQTKIQCYLEYPMYNFAEFNFYPDKRNSKSFITDYEIVMTRLFPSVEPSAFDHRYTIGIEASLQTMVRLLQSMGKPYLLQTGDHIDHLWERVSQLRSDTTDQSR